MPRAIAASEPSPKPPEKLTAADYTRLPIFALMDQMGEDDWEDKQLYIYRLFPPHDRIGAKQNLAQLSMGISKDMLEQSYGGGKFKLILKKGGETLCQATVDILGKPKWQFDREAPLTKEPPEPEKAAAPALGDPSALGQQIAAQVIDRMGNLFEKVLDRLERQQNAPPASPSLEAVGVNQAIQSSIQLVAEGAKQGMIMVAESTKGNTFSVDKILEMQSATEERILKRLETMRALSPPAAASGDPLAQINTTLEIVDKLRDKFGGEAAGFDWKSLASVVMPEVRNLIGQFIAFRNMPVRAPVFAHPAGLPAGFPPQPPVPGGEAPPYAPEAVGTGAPAPANPGPPAPTGNGEAGADFATLIKRKILRMLYEGRSGDFACEYLQVEAPQMWEQLVPIIEQGRETILTLIANDPVLAEGATHPGVAEFAQDMVDYLRSAKEEAPAASGPPVN